MASTSPVILILGSGPNVGHHVAQAFVAKGYKIALASRSVKEEDKNADLVRISADLSDPHCVKGIFSKVEASLGLPSVVVYNASAGAPNNPEEPLSIPLADFSRDLHVNTTSAFVAAQHAALSFERLPDHRSKTFIYTGNILNETTIASLLDGGVGKSATAHIIRSAAAAYSNKGFKFYYADERKADGTPVYSKISGEAHGKFYVELAEHKSQGPWQQTFVEDVGYKHFPTA
ncbi:short-chain dehydrogenase, putative [Talaromyces stipitatus ATCC 10500]|uniref:Short-chain dehydrogenase, putative n=1 Tax=Talaromyces stipitatus (strain ATCC 10500 / CBS 375.48 / QM 6759 / NRRL 1006) TaxID=441959 RepID=B8MFU0_TALSN|nr:short-chain dehydrogenase, putative [Talaromyces stipitatus ATCC 10500]EED15807.1 short-chain dehydrogenase, putative [Talaromyces stipitatus ATCC 10500]